MVDHHSRRANVLISHSQPLLCAGLVALLRREACLDLFVDGIDLLDAIKPGVDLVVADHGSALKLLVAPSARSHAALRSSKVLIVGYEPENGRVPDSFHDRFHGYTLPGCTIDHLLTQVRLLSRSPGGPGFGVAQHEDLALAKLSRS